MLVLNGDTTPEPCPQFVQDAAGDARMVHARLDLTPHAATLTNRRRSTWELGAVPSTIMARPAG